jgi:thioredoxin-dependent peroxiredoxin
MRKHKLFFAIGLVLPVLLGGCTTKQAPLVIDSTSVVPGTQVVRKGDVIALTGTGMEVGQKLPNTNLVDAATMQAVNLGDWRGSVLFLSIVPSIDTRVCEEQTHYLGEEGDTLPASIRRITISRDTPFAQVRFAEEAKLEDIRYLSDYKQGAFGRSVGLLMDGSELLARAVVLVDKQGVVRYIQVVPEVTHLPDMAEAFRQAVALDLQP